MTSTLVREWRCGKCGATKITPDGQTPSGWSLATLTPLSPDEVERFTQRDLCDGCTSNVRHFLEPTGNRAPAGVPA